MQRRLSVQNDEISVSHRSTDYVADLKIFIGDFPFTVSAAVFVFAIFGLQLVAVDIRDSFFDRQRIRDRPGDADFGVLQSRVTDDDAPRGQIDTFSEDVVPEAPVVTLESRQKRRPVRIFDFGRKKFVDGVYEAFVRFVRVQFARLDVRAYDIRIGRGRSMLRRINVTDEMWRGSQRVWAHREHTGRTARDRVHDVRREHNMPPVAMASLVQVAPVALAPGLVAETAKFPRF